MTSLRAPRREDVCGARVIAAVKSSGQNKVEPRRQKLSRRCTPIASQSVDLSPRAYYEGGDDTTATIILLPDACARDGAGPFGGVPNAHREMAFAAVERHAMSPIL